MADAVFYQARFMTFANLLWENMELRMSCQQLECSHRAAIELFASDLSNAEIARRIGVSLSTVRTWHSAYESQGADSLPVKSAASRQHTLMGQARFASESRRQSLSGTISGLVLLLIVALTLSCRSGTGRKPISTIQAELQKLQQEGIPTTAEALQEPLPRPDRNAATVYLQLDALLKSKPLAGDDKTATEFSWRSPLTADRAKKLRSAFRHRSDVARLVHLAASRPECVFKRQWSLGLELTFPEFVNMRLAARWISAESALLLYDGKPLEAVQRQSEGFRISRQLDKSPAMISYLLHVAIDAINLAGMERILYAKGEKPDVARAVRITVGREYRDMSLAYALRAEVFMVLSEMDKLRPAGPKAYNGAVMEFGEEDNKVRWPSLTAEDRNNWNGFVDRTEAVIIDNQKRMIDAADKPYPQASAAFQKVIADVKAQDNDATYIYPRQLMPIYAPFISKRACIQAKAATILAGAALLEWKALHGRFPDTLAAAISPVPVDPFDSKPLRYVYENGGFRVYSIGPSGKFDGGKPGVKPRSQESVFRCPKPAWIK